jgi:hypothetical protein
MLERDPLDEGAVHALARAHIALGESDAARAAIAAYAKRLGDELGLEPTAAIRELADAAAAGAALGRPPPCPAAPPPAPAADEFIGRRAELNRMGRAAARSRVPAARRHRAGRRRQDIGRRPTRRLARARAIVESVVFVPLADLTEVAPGPGADRRAHRRDAERRRRSVDPGRRGDRRAHARPRARQPAEQLDPRRAARAPARGGTAP